MSRGMRIDERTRQSIVAAVISGESKAAVARAYGVSRSVVRKICSQEPELTALCQQKKEEITQDVLAGMESMAADFESVIREGTARALELIGTANLRDVSTMVGIYADKLLRLADARAKSPAADDDAGGGVIVLPGATDGEE